MFVESPRPINAALSKINSLYRADEGECVARLLRELPLDEAARERIVRRAAGWVEAIRERQPNAGGLDAFLQEYDLSSREGVTLMCLAEALLRIPDPETANQLIGDRLADADWKAHLGDSDSLFVNASTWALMLTGRLVRPNRAEAGDFPGLRRGYPGAASAETLPGRSSRGRRGLVFPRRHSKPERSRPGLCKS